MKVLKNTLWTAAGLVAVTALALAPAATADQQILDDLIVDGSACVGQDCVNGESFGFDTIRLKENNLRIRAFDTSSTSSFPSRDWQITFNDSSNGGQNKFSIDDIDGGRTPFTIEGNAPSHSLYVDDGGRIGFGTSTPTVDLHVKSGNTPTLRLEQDGTSGFTPQTWDLAGNEANLFIRDATNGSTLPFRVFPGAPSNALVIEGSTGDIGMGTTSPDASLEVVGSGNPALIVSNSAAASFDLANIATTETWRMTNSGATDNSTFIVTNLSAPGAQFTVQEDGDIVAQGDVFSATCPDPTPCLPDYVFEPDYELMPIAELADFVERERHLPNVPSEEEFRTAGSFSMGQFQKQLLEKIEELTLYTLQQQGQIDELKEELATDE